MIYTEKTRKALQLCFDVHKDQVDKAGTPYVFHPFHLAEQMTDEDSVVVALLHDVVEDSDYTFEDLLSLGFSERVVDTLRLLTHDSSVPYMDYIAALKQHPVARNVKIADLTHNCDLTRFESESIDEKALKRVKKYEQAIRLLWQ